MFPKILSVFIISFSLFPISLFSLKNLDKPQNGIVYAQEEEVTTAELKETEAAQPSVTLLSVMVNNESVEIVEGDKVSVKADDAVRLAGSAKPKSKVYVYFADKELTTTAREDGYWFVLFSITNMEAGQYAVRVGDGGLEEAAKVLTLVLGESDSLVDPLEDKNNIVKIVTESKTSYIVPIILVPLAFVLGWLLGSFINKNKKEKGKKKDKK
jgi:hypothetical protein